MGGYAIPARAVIARLSDAGLKNTLNNRRSAPITAAASIGVNARRASAARNDGDKTSHASGGARRRQTVLALPSRNPSRCHKDASRIEHPQLRHDALVQPDSCEPGDGTE